MNNIEKYKNKIFEDIKHIDKNYNEYWYARELMIILGYKEWRYFNTIIEKAKTSCFNSNNNISDHFGVYTKMVDIGSKTSRDVLDYKLTRYACYLIVQNSNPRYKNVALGQTYFAIQTRKQELSEEEYNMLSENEKRLYLRKKVRNGNYRLNKTASKVGVRDFGKFHNAGYRGLYNGETADDIAKRKNLNYRQDILDYMGSDELSVNSFRISLTDQSINNNHIEGEINACNTHFEISKDIRDFIKKHGGTMPEDLPTPKSSVKQIEKGINNEIIKNN